MLSTLWNHGYWPLQWGVVIGASLVAAGWDLKSRRIPNWLTGPVLLAGLAWAAVSLGLHGLADSFLGALLMALPYLLLFIFAGGGAGDVKLTAAVGAWLGTINGLVALLAVAAAGIVLAVCISIARRQLRQVAAGVAGASVGWLTRLFFGAAKSALQPQNQTTRASRRTMPYGLAVCAGVCLAAGGVWLWR